MAQLLGSVRTRLTTDFALLLAEQEPGLRPDAYLFATSTKGALGMACGTKYADVVITVERWDSPPPLDLRAWEDRDELPFEEQRDAGPLMLAGFDPADAPGLDVEGLGRARVRVLANGRHQYFDGDHGDGEVSPEQWLLQLWPDAAGEGAMVGEPRRLASPFRDPRAATPWQAALHAWRQTGWHAFLGLDALTYTALALQRARQPMSLDELVSVVHLPGESNPSLDTPLAASLEQQRAHLTQLGAVLAIEIVTYGDLLDALLQCGLLARTHDARVVPNPAPTPVWELLELDEPTRRSIQLRVLEGDFGDIQWDIAHLIRWAPDQTLDTTPRAIALRLAVPVRSVLGGLELLNVHGRAHVVPDFNMLGADDPMTASRTPLT